MSGDNSRLQNVLETAGVTPTARTTLGLGTEVKERYHAILYIIMRTDLASMNPGKAIAQGSHASNAAAKHAENMVPGLYEDWRGESFRQNFGTVIVLAGKNMEAIQDLLDEVAAKTITSTDPFQSNVRGVVLDETYPLRDGSVTHHIPLETCAYIMCYRGSKANEIVRGRDKEFPMHK